jgi:hypothetical protein
MDPFGGIMEFSNGSGRRQPYRPARTSLGRKIWRGVTFPFRVIWYILRGIFKGIGKCLKVLGDIIEAIFEFLGSLAN